jgi:hypothetical protein
MTQAICDGSAAVNQSGDNLRATLIPGLQETVMDIVYAAEKRSIADILSHRLHQKIEPHDIDVQDNPDQTGSFFVRRGFDQYVMSPSGEVERIGVQPEDR